MIEFMIMLVLHIPALFLKFVFDMLAWKETGVQYVW